MENTNNLNLPLLVPNQSQKEITHNEALVILDVMIQNGIIDKDLNIPPINPSINDLYIVGNNAINEWFDKDLQLAYYNNGWRFVKPKQGFTFWVNDENCQYTFDGNNWILTNIKNNQSINLADLKDVLVNSLEKEDILQYNGSKFINTKIKNTFDKLAINTSTDDTNKLNVKSDSVLFDNNNSDSKVIINKAKSSDSASYVFQDNYIDKFEFGLIKNNDFSLKKSNDGINWNDIFVVDNATGNVDFKTNIKINGNDFSNLVYMPLAHIVDPTEKGYIYNVCDSPTPITLPEGGTWFYITSVCWSNVSAQYIFTEQKAGIEAGGTKISFAQIHGSPHYSLMGWKIQ